MSLNPRRILSFRQLIIPSLTRFKLESLLAKRHPILPNKQLTCHRNFSSRDSIKNTQNYIHNKNKQFNSLIQNKTKSKSIKRFQFPPKVETIIRLYLRLQQQANLNLRILRFLNLKKEVQKHRQLHI